LKHDVNFKPRLFAGHRVFDAFNVMNSITKDNWRQANQQFVASPALFRSALLLQTCLMDFWRGVLTLRALQQGMPSGIATEAMPGPPALETLCAMFGLSPFERDVLLLCAGMELDATFPVLCASAQGDPQRAYPTFSLAQAALPAPHWSAITPAGPLRRWRLIEVGAGNAITLSPLRIDERVLHYLTGIHHLDERLVGFIQTPRLETPGDLATLGQPGFFAGTWGARHRNAT